MNQTRTIEIIGDANRISVELLHRDFPEAQDYADGNWVTARFRVDGTGGNPSLVSHIEFTESLHLGDLERFRRELAHVSEQGQGQASLAMMEQYLTLVATLRQHTVHWKGRIKIRRKLRPDQSGPSQSNVLRHFVFKTELSSLAALLTQVEAVLEQFPVRSPRSREGRTDDSFKSMPAYPGRGENPNHPLYGGRSPLSVAAQMGQSEAVRLLLDAGADLHDADTTGTTALWGAAGNGRLDTVRLLLERGARINGPDGTGDTILMLAARNGDEEGFPEVVRLLLEAGANAQARDDHGWTALTWAAGVGHEATVELLLKHGVDPNAATEDGVTPLMCAAKGGHMGIVRLLRERGADASLQDRKGRAACDFAEEVGWADPGVRAALK